ncbi:hypothetical protein BD410DRAFT_725294, partial [Rickenella mellea]
MNRAWLDRQKSLAINASFQQPGHANETASDYVNRKVGLLDLVYDYTDSELMIEVLKTAPESWSKLLDTQRFPTFHLFQDAVSWHEHILTGGSKDSLSDFDRRLKNLEAKAGPRANANLVGTGPSFGKPKFPRDDSNVSKGKTPEQKGARPCRYCGSPKHWDPECKHAKKGAKFRAKANLAAIYTEEDIQADLEYDALYY